MRPSHDRSCVFLEGRLVERLGEHIGTVLLSVLVLHHNLTLGHPLKGFEVPPLDVP